MQVVSIRIIKIMTVRYQESALLKCELERGILNGGVQAPSSQFMVCPKKQAALYPANGDKHTLAPDDEFHYLQNIR